MKIDIKSIASARCSNYKIDINPYNITGKTWCSKTDKHGCRYRWYDDVSSRLHLLHGRLSFQSSSIAVTDQVLGQTFNAYFEICLKLEPEEFTFLFLTLLTL